SDVEHEPAPRRRRLCREGPHDGRSGPDLHVGHRLAPKRPTGPLPAEIVYEPRVPPPALLDITPAECPSFRPCRSPSSSSSPSQPTKIARGSRSHGTSPRCSTRASR